MIFKAMFLWSVDRSLSTFWQSVSPHAYKWLCVIYVLIVIFGIIILPSGTLFQSVLTDISYTIFCMVLFTWLTRSYLQLILHVVVPHFCQYFYNMLSFYADMFHCPIDCCLCVFSNTSYVVVFSLLPSCCYGLMYSARTVRIAHCFNVNIYVPLYVRN